MIVTAIAIFRKNKKVGFLCCLSMLIHTFLIYIMINVIKTKEIVIPIIRPAKLKIMNKGHPS